MTVQEFKSNILMRWELSRALLGFSFRESVAHVGNNYASVMSTTLFVVTYMIFLRVLYGNIRTLAGYSYSEMLFFSLVAQIGFYLTWSVSIVNRDLLSDDIKSGRLDLWLTRPAPILWLENFQKIDIVRLLFDSIPALIPMVVMLAKSWDLKIYATNLLWGSVVFVMGLVIAHCFQLMTSMSSFWLGENKNLRVVAYEVGFYADGLPFEGFPQNIRRAATLFIPTMVTCGLTASVILGKTTNIPLVLSTVAAIMLMFVVGENVFWREAIKHYSSASS